MKKENIKEVLGFFIFPLVVYLLNLILVLFFNEVFVVYPWIDIPMHFIGGAAIGFSFILLFSFFEKQNLIKIKSKDLFVLLIVSLVSFSADIKRYFIRFAFRNSWRIFS